MKNLLSFLQKKDQELIKSYSSKELENINQVMQDLKIEHEQIKERLNKINHLLDLIDKHQIEGKPSKDNKENNENWLEKLKIYFEKIHIFPSQNLTKEDTEKLEIEKGKLLTAKQKSQNQHKHIHTLIAKVNAYLIDVQNKVCEEITKGYDIAKIGQKLKDAFGNKLKERDYQSGKRKITQFLEDTFNINRIEVEKVFTILEKSNTVHYQINLSNIYQFPSYKDFTEYENLTYIPIDGIWIINA